MAGADSLRLRAHSGAHDGGHDKPAHRWWPIAKRVLTVVFFAAVAYMLWRFGRDVEWDSVWRTLRAAPPLTLLAAAGIAVASHGLFASFDLVGRHITGHKLTVPRTLAVAWTAYVFNLNLGALVGGVGFRYRLYSRLGLDHGTIAKVYGLSVVTNWVGYSALAGIAFLLWQPDVPAGWAVGTQGLQIVGLVLPLVALAYLLACTFVPGRKWRWRSFDFELPPARVALLQLGLSTVNWMLVAAVVYTLLGQRVAYSDVVAVMLLAAVAGAIAHVPAGLGVLEGVFIALLGQQLPHYEILAALLTYRAIYYLLPLLLAIGLFAYMELTVRKRKRETGAA